MVQKEKREEKKTETGADDGHPVAQSFEEKLVVLLKTRLQVLEVQIQIFKELKFEASTIGTEKKIQLDIERNYGKVEELNYLIKMASIK